MRFRSFHAALFAPDSLPALSSLSTVGLVLFMFIVGAELRAPDGVRAQLRAAGWVGVLSVLLPMAMGIGIAPLLHPTLAPAGVGFWPFALFMAAAMSITAFPIMARILKERGMTHTRIGRLSLSGAAIADVFAWIMLALVVALIGCGRRRCRLPQDHAGAGAAVRGGVRRSATAVRLAAATLRGRRPAVRAWCWRRC